ncbi:hypothetical protein L9F63_024963 [Diploptera punctata]|uniref:Ionotropic glutamate receptor C-terminal domain-containing protein n=1 Tax=Diploptera punctata TaxID=6984 RepID=A0AAD7ZFF6_DIPPU|nr:hypothetical protein L9F63_024963 [Diploptera punctata]
MFLIRFCIFYRFHVRILILMWIMFSLCVNTVYQAFLTSYLIDTGFYKQISSEEEMLESGIDFGYHPITELVHTDMVGERYKRRNLCSNMGDCISRVAYRADMAVFIVKILADHMLYTKYVDSNGKPLLCHVDEMFSSVYYSMLLQKGSVYLEKFDKIILQLNQAGITEFWWRNLSYNDRINAVKMAEPKSDEYIVLEIKHFLSTIVLLLFGYVTSVIALLCEVLSNKIFKCFRDK